MADKSIKLPEFSGDVAQDTMTVIEYINQVEMSKTAANWSDAVTAEKVKLKLVGPARIWLQNRIRALTPGLNAFDPEAPEGGGAAGPGLRRLLLDRFMPQQTAGEQERLRATLLQGDNEQVQVFYDRCESIQFILDLELPEDFRKNSKASYDIVHDRQVRGSFIAGLKADIRRHVTTLNVADTAEAVKAAVAFEKARTPVKAPTIGATVGDSSSIEARMAALEFNKQAAFGRGQGKLAEEGCFYCGFIGHNKPDCRMKKNDEAKGIFRKRADGYQPGRIGRGSRGGGQTRGGQQYRGGFQGNGGYQQRGGGRGRGSGQYRGQQQQRGGYVHSAESTTFNQQPIVPMPGTSQFYHPWQGFHGPPSQHSNPGSTNQETGPLYDQGTQGGLNSFRFEPEN